MTEMERYTEAWRDRRKRMLVFKAMQIAFFPLLVVLTICVEYADVPSSMIAIPVWFAGYIATGVWLNRFRCPRCGKLYYWRVQLKGAAERQKKWRNCHWCGLPQDALPSLSELAHG